MGYRFVRSRYHTGHFSQYQFARGFSLIELVIVISILAILASIVIPRFSSASDEAKIAQASANLRTIQVEVQQQFLNFGHYPDTLDPAWFKSDELPPNPFAEGDYAHTFQVYSNDDPLRRIPESKEFKQSASWARPIWYHEVFGDVYFRIPEMEDQVAALQLFNRINGVQMTSMDQDVHVPE